MEVASAVAGVSEGAKLSLAFVPSMPVMNGKGE
jgi:hypothetical protein